MNEQWIYQTGSDFETWGKVISPLKNGGMKVITFTSFNGSKGGSAKMDSTKNWYPAAQNITSLLVPDFVKVKIEKKIKELGLTISTV